jgi:hypothetical protein
MMTAGPSIPSSAPSTTTTATPSPALSLSHSASHSTFNSNTNVNGTVSATGTPNLSSISPSLRAQFVEEINRKKPTEEEVAAWNKHAQDIVSLSTVLHSQSRCLTIQCIHLLFYRSVHSALMPDIPDAFPPMVLKVFDVVYATTDVGPVLKSGTSIIFASNAY